MITPSFWHGRIMSSKPLSPERLAQGFAQREKVEKASSVHEAAWTDRQTAWVPGPHLHGLGLISIPSGDCIGCSAASSLPPGAPFHLPLSENPFKCNSILKPLLHACLMNVREMLLQCSRVGSNLVECLQVIWRKPWERSQFYYGVIRNKISLQELNERRVLIL